MNGGVTIWVDADDTEPRTISNIDIYDNVMTTCGGFGATGGVTIYAVSGMVPQTVTDISIHNNSVYDSPRGGSVFSVVDEQMFSDIQITDNYIENCWAGIQVGAMNGDLMVSCNNIINSLAEGIAVAFDHDGSIVGMGSGDFEISNNYISNFMGGSSNSYAVRPGGISVGSGDPNDYAIYSNTIIDPQVSSPAYYGIYSIIELSKAALLYDNPGLNLANTKGVYTKAP